MDESVEWQLETRHKRVAVARMKRVCWFVKHYWDGHGASPNRAQIEAFLAAGQPVIFDPYRKMLIDEGLIIVDGHGWRADYRVTERGVQLVENWNPPETSNE